MKVYELLNDLKPLSGPAFYPAEETVIARTMGSWGAAGRGTRWLPRSDVDLPHTFFAWRSDRLCVLSRVETSTQIDGR